MLIEVGALTFSRLMKEIFMMESCGIQNKYLFLYFYFSTNGQG